MSEEYDEPIEDNIFFKEIQEKYSDLILRATQENWIICVPRVESLQNTDITEVFILEHILVPDMELPESNFITLTKKYVQYHQNLLIVKNVDDIINKVSVLFKQVFYVKGLKYEVWCLDHPINTKKRSGTKRIIYLNNIQDCIKLLMLENPKIIAIVQTSVEKFIKYNPDITVSQLDLVESLIRTLYTECIDQILENKPLANKLSINSRLLMQVQLSVEMYLQHCFNKKLFYSVVNYNSFDDSKFNKIIRNLNYLQLKHFQIPAAYCERITYAKIELTKLNNYYTSLEKIICLKNVFNTIKNDRNFLNCKQTIPTLTTDNLLQIITFLIIKTNVNNWIANLRYLSQFQFNCSINLNDENNFLLTTLEAAIEYIKSGVLYNNITKPEIETFTTLQSSQDNVFEAVKAGNLDKVNELLKNSDKYRGMSKQCHPLCSCDNCETNEMKYSINSYDNKGRSLLHIACFNGHPRVVDYLLINGIYVDYTDYSESTPLHYSVTRGFQNCTLLLLHAKADINRCDLDGNTPMHLAVNNGHENCVKALIYYSEYSSNAIDLNFKNNLGDTPLHFACKWGYLNIVEILLQYNVDTQLKNKRQQLPCDVAQNIYIKRSLLKLKENRNEEQISIANENSDVAKCKFKKIDRLLKAIEDNDVQLTRFYLGINATINHLNLPSGTCHPLCTCEKCPKYNDNIKNYNKDIVNVNKCNVEGYAPIHIASKFGRTDILRLILDSGSSVNIKTYNNLKSALHLACIFNQIDVVKELLKCGNCDLDIKDSNGNTPLHDAVRFNNEKIVEILLVNGANVNIKSNNGELPLNIAKAKKNVKLIKTIKNYL